MGFVECLRHLYSYVTSTCGTDLIPTSCGGVSDDISKARRCALSCFECGYTVLLGALETLAMTNLRCLPTIADGIRAALLPPEAIIATAVFEALRSFGESVVSGIYEEAAA
eukprot:2138731-Pyramimonas_sp.AAC.1